MVGLIDWGTVLRKNPDKRKYLEEVPVKWMDRPSATEMERGCASEMDRQTKCHTNENATEMNKSL